MRPGQWPSSEPDQFRWAGVQYVFQTFDLLFRDERPFEVGERIELTDCAIEIVAVTADGRPASVAFRFDRALEHDAFRWVCWDDGKYAAFQLPAVGEKVKLPPARPPVPQGL